MGRRPEIINRKKRKRNRIILVIVCIIAALSLFIALFFKVQTIRYEGNNHYTDEQMNELLFKGETPNALFVKIFGINDSNIPFIQKCDIEVTFPNIIDITVYEKSIIGYIDYMGSRMYFDKDGVVVESSSQKYEGVPEIAGLDFKQIVLNEKLDVGNDSVYNEILGMTQSFEKYDMNVNKVYFDSDYNVVLYINDVKVNLGSSGDYTDKLFELNLMKDQISNLKGVLHMENYTGDESAIIFKKDN